MKIKKILLSNWFLSSTLTLLLLLCMLLEFYPWQLLEYKTYDLLTKIQKREDKNPIVVVAIDEKSIDQIGCWPWPRSYIAKMVQALSKYGAHTTGIGLLYSGKELNTGLTEVRDLRERLYKKRIVTKKKDLYKVDETLAAVEKKLNHDAYLMSTVRSAINVVMPLRFSTIPSEDKSKKKISGWLKRNSIELNNRAATPPKRDPKSLKLTSEQHKSLLDIQRVIPTYDELARKAGALGHLNLMPDKDGILRRVPLLIQYQNRFFPYFGLQVAAKYSDSSLTDIKTKGTDNGFRGLRLKEFQIPTDDQFRMLIDFSALGSQVQTYSFVDVYNGRIPPEQFKNKIVLLGITAETLTPTYQTAFKTSVPNITIAANIIENIINQKHLSRPSWASTVEIIAVLYFGLFLYFVIPRVNPKDGALILGIFLVTWIGFVIILFVTYNYWLRLYGPVFLSLIGYSLSVYRIFSGKKEDESLELNKMLGLSFQGQGMLDMAFEKFMKCPVENPSVKELLYNLGLDFERKRMFNKALAVYDHILKAGKFKDIQDKIVKLKSIGDTFALSSNSSRPEATILIENADTKPTLGRYEVLKELGRGAMGMVYLGRDPKINRKVAIKTLRYMEVDEDQLTEVKNRFFYEAEAAGKLSHPNIVTIYDVGEDYDMAYMAMELLEGNDLTKYCQKEKQLPVHRILNTMYAVAEALDYAHKNDVAHRDIKPANIMLLKNDQVKVTDFGIARVMSASRTQTGVIFGTPNYMSPEQVAGKKVDGRSDLFSLGAVFYEMLTGQKPFKGDSLATLMYAITSVQYSPIPEVNPHVPRCCIDIVNRLLTKQLTKRFKNAAQLMQQLEMCIALVENDT